MFGKQVIMLPVLPVDFRSPFSFVVGQRKHHALPLQSVIRSKVVDKQSYYTLLFDREEDMDLVGDTSLTSVQVEWIFVKKRMVKKYYFERIKGAWMLEAINLRPIEENENEDFVEFFGHFATDSIFQSRRIRQPLVFVTTDPDDDFSILETTLDLNQWFAFKPALPADKLSNINYGQQNDDNA